MKLLAGLNGNVELLALHAWAVEGQLHPKRLHNILEAELVSGFSVDSLLV